MNTQGESFLDGGLENNTIENITGGGPKSSIDIIDSTPTYVVRNNSNNCGTLAFILIFVFILLVLMGIMIYYYCSYNSNSKQKSQKKPKETVLD